MRTRSMSLVPRFAALGLVAVVATATATSAATVYLRAGVVHKTMPDGQDVTFWGFAQDSAFGAQDGTLSVPGPRIAVPQGDSTLDIVLDNRLPQPVSIVVPGQINELYKAWGSGDDPVPVVPTWTDGSTGPRTDPTQRVRSFAPETEPDNVALGTGVHYIWNNLKAGTYLYESGTHPAVQVQMGLYGCLTRDAAAGPQAYPGVPYDNDAVFLFSEVDDGLHAAVAAGTYGTAPYTSTMDYEPSYFLINGAAYPGSNVTWTNGPPLTSQRLLLRFLNAGEETRVPEIQGAYMDVVSEDGSKYAYARKQYTVVLSAGKTYDAVMSGMFAGPHPMFDRRLGLTNDTQSPGGMIVGIDNPSLTVTQDDSAPVPALGPTLLLNAVAAGGGAVASDNIQFTWQDIPEATSYKVYQSASPTRPFAAVAATATTGITGATVPPPPGTLVFYVVTGVNGPHEGGQQDVDQDPCSFVTCAPSDACHEAGVCDPSTGLCSDPPKANGTACDDGSACTQTDACEAGVCVGADAVVCSPASDACHEAGVCDPSTGLCSNPAKADGSACSDGDACTQSDSCQAGSCLGASPVTCAALDSCHEAGTCDPGTGACSNPAKADGSACDDGNACTQTDACEAGACTGANPVTCTALDQCHDAGICDPGTQICSNPVEPDGTACDDGDLGTVNDVCTAGVCSGTAP